MAKNKDIGNGDFSKSGKGEGNFKGVMEGTSKPCAPEKNISTGMGGGKKK
jgi:hypothetical protein